MSPLRALRWPWTRPGPPAGGPSRTSQAVALIRAGFVERPTTPEGDSGAQQALCRGMLPTPAALVLRPQIAARTRFFDEQVLGAIAAGVTQIVICGAGYDDRALRFRSSGVRYFELDHPDTQVDKAARLAAMGADMTALTLAAIDFRVDEAAFVLERAGHDSAHATLFLCEGLLIYLERATCVRLLAGLRSRSAPGSVLAASLALHRDGIDSEEVAAVANARRRSGRSEPWVTIMPLEAHLAMLRQAGWVAERSVDAAELDGDAEPGRTLLVRAAISGTAYGSAVDG
jgi:methyltransferase (TIGR00027 family)